MEQQRALEPERKRLGEKITLLQEKLHDYETLEQQESEIRQHRKELEKVTRREEQEKKQQIKWQEAREKLCQELETLSKIDADEGQLKLTLQSFTERRSNLLTLQEQCRLAVKLEKQWEQERQALESGIAELRTSESEVYPGLSVLHQ